MHNQFSSTRLTFGRIAFALVCVILVGCAPPSERLEVDSGCVQGVIAKPLVRLTDSPGEDHLPDWSPDGSKIAFGSNRDGNDDIYTMSPDGSGVNRITASRGRDSSPAWSPDGSTLAWVYRDSDGQRIKVSAPDGSKATLLTTRDFKPGDAGDYFPAWSLDGRQIHFHGGLPPQYGNHVMNSDGTGSRFLGVIGRELTWSPEGTKFAVSRFYSQDEGTDIVVRDVGTGIETRLTHNSIHDNSPDWSPDGRRIAFARSESFWVWNIYVMNSDGSNLKRLTSNSSWDASPTWSPDGTKIAFDSNCGGDRDIYVVNVD